MDQLPNEQTRTETERRPRRRPQKIKRFELKLPGFLTRIGEDVRWYYDVRLWSPVILALLIAAVLIPGRQTKAEPEPTTPEIVMVQLEPQEVTEPVPEPTEPIDVDAEALAKLADSVGAGRSKRVKEAIMWLVINRSENWLNGYGKSLMDEIARPDQWQGYDPETEYSQETYELAKKVLKTWVNGELRPVDEDMLWLVLNDNGSITVRNKFTGGSNNWKEKTYK